MSKNNEIQYPLSLRNAHLETEHYASFVQQHGATSPTVSVKVLLALAVTSIAPRPPGDAMRLFLIVALHALCAVFAAVQHVPLGRGTVPASRIFSHARRPWMRMAIESVPISKRRIHSRFVRPKIRVGGSINGSLPQEPLYGGVTTVGEYFAVMLFGGQKVRVQIDTGSSTLAVPLADCINCRRHDMRFDLKRAKGTASVIHCDSPACSSNTCGSMPDCRVCSSSTRACCSRSAPRECGFYLRYADGSGAQGALVEGDVALAGFSAPVLFGGILRQVSNFETPFVDGIFGMAYKALACNPTCVSPLFDTLVETGKVERDVFSICTGRIGGTLTLGGNNPDQYVGDLKYVPMTKGRRKMFYDVNIRGVEIGGNSVRVPKFTSGIVDSGTTVLVVTNSAYLSLKAYFQSNYCHVPLLCPKGIKQIVNVTTNTDDSVRLIRNDRTTARSYDDDDIDDDQTWFSPAVCVSLPDTFIKQLPTISIVLENDVKLELEPDVYMLKITSDYGTLWSDPQVYHCLGIQPLKELEYYSNNVIIGDTVLQKYYYEIDRENNRVGFAKSKDCNLSPDSIAAMRPSSPTAEPSPNTFGKVLFFLLIPIAIVAFFVTRHLRNKRQGYSEIISTS